LQSIHRSNTEKQRSQVRTGSNRNGLRGPSQIVDALKRKAERKRGQVEQGVYRQEEVSFNRFDISCMRNGRSSLEDA